MTDLENLSTTAVEDSTEVDTTTTSQELENQINLIENTMKTLRSQLSDLKKVKREIMSLEKDMAKVTRKKNKTASNRKSGFTLPVGITD